VARFTSRPLYPQRKNPWYPLDRRLGGPQNRSGRGGEEKISQPPPAKQDRRVTAIIFNKQSWTADKGYSSSFGDGRGANNSSP
jgi:hypothetical protein